jgi:hypothetical protein
VPPGAGYVISQYLVNYSYYLADGRFESV